MSDGRSAEHAGRQRATEQSSGWSGVARGRPPADGSRLRTPCGPDSRQRGMPWKLSDAAAWLPSGLAFSTHAAQGRPCPVGHSQGPACMHAIWQGRLRPGARRHGGGGNRPLGGRPPFFRLRSHTPLTRAAALFRRSPPTFAYFWAASLKPKAAEPPACIDRSFPRHGRGSRRSTLQGRAAHCEPEHNRSLWASWRRWSTLPGSTCNHVGAKGRGGGGRPAGAVATPPPTSADGHASCCCRASRRVASGPCSEWAAGWLCRRLSCRSSLAAAASGRQWASTSGSWRACSCGRQTARPCTRHIASRRRRCCRRGGAGSAARPGRPAGGRRRCGAGRGAPPAAGAAPPDAPLAPRGGSRRGGAAAAGRP